MAGYSLCAPTACNLTIPSFWETRKGWNSDPEDPAHMRHGWSAIPLIYLRKPEPAAQM